VNPTPDLLATGNPLSAAAQLLRALVARYALVGSYRDTGVVLVHLPSDEVPFEVPFQTAYEAPGRYRFQFDFPHPHPTLRRVSTRYVVGSDGEQAYSHTHVPEHVPERRLLRTLSLALAGTTGLACGAAHTIAQLLLAGVRGTALTDLTDLRLDGHRLVDGVLCHRLLGTHPYAGPHELLIGRDDLLLRKLSKRSANMPIEEVRQAIALDVPGDPAHFRMPPA